MKTKAEFRDGGTSMLRLKKIMLDEAMKLEPFDDKKATALMEEVMRSFKEEAGVVRQFRPPRPK